MNTSSLNVGLSSLTPSIPPALAQPRERVVEPDVNTYAYVKLPKEQVFPEQSSGDCFRLPCRSEETTRIAAEKNLQPGIVRVKALPKNNRWMDPERSFGRVVEPLRAYSYSCSRAAEISGGLVGFEKRPVLGIVARKFTIGVVGITIAPCAAGVTLARGLRATVWTAKHQPKEWDQKMKIIESALSTCDIADPQLIADMMHNITRHGASKYNLEFKDLLRVLRCQERLLRRVGDLIVQQGLIENSVALTPEQFGEAYNQAKISSMTYEEKWGSGEMAIRGKARQKEADPVSTGPISRAIKTALFIVKIIALNIFSLISSLALAAVLIPGVARFLRHLGHYFDTVDFSERRKMETKFDAARKEINKLDHDHLPGCSLFFAFGMARNALSVSFQPELARKQMKLNAYIGDKLVDWLRAGS